MQGKSGTEYHAAAAGVRERVPPHVPLFATGPVFFELDALRAEEWNVRVQAFPSAIEVHPGMSGTREQMIRDLPKLRSLGTFIWCGDARSAEAAFLRQAFRTSVQARYGGTIVLLASR